MGMDRELLEILACPACQSKVIEESDWIVCTHSACGLRFPIRDGIPVMLIEEAQKPEAGGEKPEARK